MTSRISQQDHESNNQEASSSVSASMRPQHEEKASEANTNDSSASITAASHHDASSTAPTSDPSSSEYPEPYSKVSTAHYRMILLVWIGIWIALVSCRNCLNAGYRMDTMDTTDMVLITQNLMVPTGTILLPSVLFVWARGLLITWNLDPGLCIECTVVLSMSSTPSPSRV